MARFIKRFAMSQDNPFLKLFQQRTISTARLANLRPGNKDASIEIDLEDAALGETTYECISYDRTEDNSSLHITVSGSQQSIPKHLELALRTLRRREQPRKLWADVLVGSNAQERSTQANAMRAILEQADKTLCWIGDDNEKTAAAFATLREMSNRWTQACTQYDIPANWRRASTDQMQKVHDRLRSCKYNDLNSFDFSHWNEIYRIFSSSYWKSVSNVAEIVLAKKAILICGRSNMTFEMFIPAMLALPVFQGKFFAGVPLLPSVMNNLQIIDSIALADHRKRAGETIELLPMILTARSAKPKDPRDSVFSMLPIATPSLRREYHNLSPDLPDIDYSKTTKQVFIEASRYIVLERQDLMLWFSEVPPCAKSIKDLPSWCPDWSLEGGRSLITPKNGMRAWWDTLPKDKLTDITISDNNKLHLQTVAIDDITYVSPIFHAANFKRLLLKEWKRLNENTAVSPAIEEQFWRSVLSNHYGFGEHLNTPGEPPARIGDSFRSVIAEEEIFETLGIANVEELTKPANIARVRNDERLQALCRAAGKGAEFEALMMKQCFGRRFFATQQGLFGMTSVENYKMLDDEFLQRDPKDNPSTTAGDSGQAPVPTDMGEVMSNPLARGMLQAFQQHLQTKDPAQAELVAKMMRGELPHQQEQAKKEEQEHKGVQVGDVIVAAVGGFQPYVLRPPKEGTEAYDSAEFEYVGNCYLHGVMNGELFIMEDDEGKQYWRQDIELVDIQIA